VDFNHDFNGNNEFLLTGTKERLQMVKAAILSFGDMGYTDPPVPNIQYAIGDYTDSNGRAALEGAIRENLISSMVVRPDEIVSIQVVSPIGDNKFQVQLGFTFGTLTVEHPGISGE
jgi:hypothetical protein